MVWPAPYIALDLRALPNHPLPGTVTVNQETKEILYLSSDVGYSLLNRYDAQRRHTGNYILPGFPGTPQFDPTELSLAAWSSNRLAFHTQSNLYLVNLDKVFLPADVEVVRQEVSVTNLTFAQSVRLNLVVTNHGPGAALAVLITNALPEGTLLKPEDLPRSRGVGMMHPGATAEFEFTVVPATPGVFTNRAGVTAKNDGNPANEWREFTTTVALPNPQLFMVPSWATDLAYDNGTGRLFYYNGLGEMAVMEVVGPRLLRPIKLPVVARLAMDASEGSVLAGYLPNGFKPLYVGRVSATDLTAGVERAGYYGLVMDLAVSPRDSKLVVTAGDQGTYVSWNELFTRVDTKQGNLGFNEDGTVLYRSDEMCALDIFALSSGTVSFVRRATNVACGKFTVLGELVVFDSGQVYQPETGEKRGLGLTPPLFVTRSQRGQVDVLRRISGQWAASRLDRETLRPISTNFFPELPTGILDVIRAGENRLALRTLTDVYVLELTAAFGGLSLRQAGPGEIELRFNTGAGKRYRVERTEQLPGGWSVVGGEINGDGFSTRVILNTGGSNRAFYRVVEGAGG